MCKNNQDHSLSSIATVCQEMIHSPADDELPMHPSFSRQAVFFTENLLCVEERSRRIMIAKTGERGLTEKMDGLEKWLETLIVSLSTLAPIQLEDLIFFGNSDLLLYRNDIRDALWRIKKERSKWNEAMVAFGESKRVYDNVQKGFGGWGTARSFKMSYLFVSLYCGINSNSMYRTQGGAKRFLFDIFLDKTGTVFRDIHSAVGYITARFIRFQQWSVRLRQLGVHYYPLTQTEFVLNREKVRRELENLLSVERTMCGTVILRSLDSRLCATKDWKTKGTDSNVSASVSSSPSNSTEQQDSSAPPAKKMRFFM